MVGELERIEKKLEKIAEEVTDIRISAGRTEEHLGTINGRCEARIKDIKELRQKISNNTKAIWLATGGVMVLGIVLSIISILKSL